MRFNLSRTVRTGRAVPSRVLGQIQALAELSHCIPLEEVAPPVWKLPRGVRIAAVSLALVALVTGVRVLDAEISTLEPVVAAVQDARIPAPPLARPEKPAPTAIMVEVPPDGDTHRFLQVTVSAYTSAVDETDQSPHYTAQGKPTRPGTLALSRDLLRTFTPDAPFDFGDRVLIPGMGIYLVEDTMHPRWTRKADIWFSDRTTALRWGVRNVYLTEVEAGGPFLVAREWHS